MKLEQLIKVGGKEWVKDSLHRVYFNNLEQYVNLEIARYNTGNVSSASLDGVKLANSKASSLASDLKFGKIYYDLNLKEFKFSGMHETLANKIIEKIKAACEE